LKNNDSQHYFIDAGDHSSTRFRSFVRNASRASASVGIGSLKLRDSSSLKTPMHQWIFHAELHCSIDTNRNDTGLNRGGKRRERSKN